jgi:hypothetical protein
MGKERNAQKMLVQKSLEKQPLEKVRRLRQTTGEEGCEDQR